VVAQLVWGFGDSLGLWWRSCGCGGSIGDVVAQLGIWWLSWDGDLVTQWGCGGSVGDVVAQLVWGFGDSVGMWWRSCGCGGSIGDVVAQLGIWWLSWDGDYVTQWGRDGSVG
jgi:hypothetical protein